MNEDNKKEELTEEEKKRIEFDNHLRFAQGSISYKNPKEISASTSSISMSTIQQALSDPYNNVSTLQQISKIMYYANGIYTRLIEEFTNIPIYDLYLTPTSIIGYNGKTVAIDKMNKEYEQIAQQVEKTNYKYNFKWFGRMLLMYGELYLYKVEDNSGLFFKMIPPDICRVSGIMENNIYKYSIDLSKLSDADLLSTMPIPIQKLYERYQSGGLDNDEKLVNSYYHLEDNEAVAFLYDDGNTRTKGIPPLCYLFDKIYRINEIEDEDLASSAVDNLKILHQRPQINDEGELLMDLDILNKYHQATKRALPKGVAITTNPLAMEVFTLQRQSNAGLSTTQKAYEAVYTSAGVNSELFNGSRSSSESVINSIKTDEMIVDRLNGIFGNFINYEIKNKKRNAMWKAEMLRNTYFNRKDIQSTCREDAMVGCGLLKYLSSLGYTPLTGLSSLMYESQQNLSALFRPLSSGYNSNSEDNGRPSNAENDDSELNAPQAENATSPKK